MSLRGNNQDVQIYKLRRVHFKIVSLHNRSSLYAAGMLCFRHEVSTFRTHHLQTTKTDQDSSSHHKKSAIKEEMKFDLDNTG